jgi:hypothetical protein
MGDKAVNNARRLVAKGSKRRVVAQRERLRWNNQAEDVIVSKRNAVRVKH